MSTCNNELLDSKLNEIHKERTINIICKNLVGNVIFVDSLKYDKKFEYPEDVGNEIKISRNLENTYLSADYDDSAKTKYIVALARKNNSIIDWNINFGGIKIYDMFRINNSNVVNINLNEIGEMGCALGPITGLIKPIIVGVIIERIGHYLNLLINKMKNAICIRKKPYEALIKHMELFYDEKFIKKVICLNKSWPVGFITNRDIPNKKAIEKAIMKNLGYKKESNIWIKESVEYEDKFVLCKNEILIVGKCNEILEDYNVKNREKQKKLYELFHLLTFFDISGIKYKSIKANEPGDFIVKIKGKETMIEVVTNFGNRRSNKMMIDNIKKVFSFNVYVGDTHFDTEEMKENFERSINKKQNSHYDFNNKVLLIVTAEYDNCPVTGAWYLKHLEKNILNNIDNFDEIWAIDYFSSGKDNGPTITTDLKSELIEYKEQFDKD